MIRLSPGTISAMRHICLCDKKKLFSFSLSESAQRELGEVSERFLLHQLGQSFPALDFYRRLFPQEDRGAI